MLRYNHRPIQSLMVSALRSGMSSALTYYRYRNTAQVKSNGS